MNNYLEPEGEDSVKILLGMILDLSDQFYRLPKERPKLQLKEVFVRCQGELKVVVQPWTPWPYSSLY